MAVTLEVAIESCKTILRIREHCSGVSCDDCTVKFVDPEGMCVSTTGSNWALSEKEKYEWFERWLQENENTQPEFEF